MGLLHHRDGVQRRFTAQYIAGCDGRHGVARQALLAGGARLQLKDHGVSWLVIPANARRSMPGVTYAIHDAGLADHMARSSPVTRCYIQCACRPIDTEGGFRRDLSSNGGWSIPTRMC